jgi:TIR domain
MRTHIFENYRQSDDPGGAGRLFDRLKARFGAQRVYFDQSVNQGGDRYKEEIKKHILSARVFLVVIGPRWLDAIDNNGYRRIDDPNDLLRKEIIWAQASPKRIIPILLHGANMPRARDLPDDISTVTDLHAERISHGTFDADVERVMKVITAQIGQPSASNAGLSSRPPIRVPDPTAINQLLAGLPHNSEIGNVGNAFAGTRTNSLMPTAYGNALLSPFIDTTIDTNPFDNPNHFASRDNPFARNK